MYTTFSELVILMYLTRNSMNNLLSYCGLLNVRINAPEKDLPVTRNFIVETGKPCIKQNCPKLFSGTATFLSFLSGHESLTVKQILCFFKQT